jgi:hypothetical protein
MPRTQAKNWHRFQRKYIVYSLNSKSSYVIKANWNNNTALKKMMATMSGHAIEYKSRPNKQVWM